MLVLHNKRTKNAISKKTWSENTKHMSHTQFLPFPQQPAFVKIMTTIQAAKPLETLMKKTQHTETENRVYK